MKHLFLSTLILFLNVSFSVQASESAWILPLNSSYWELQSAYGRYQENNQQFQQASFLAHGEIGFLETATLFMDIPFLTRMQSQPGQTPDYLINNGLTDMRLGLRMRLFSDVISQPWSLALRTAIRFPVGYNPGLAPVIGDHTFDSELGLGLGYDFSPFEAYVQSGLSYRYRARYERSHIILTQAKEQGLTVFTPADQVIAYSEAGIWITPQVFAAISLTGEFGINDKERWVQSQLFLRPLVAWRLNPYADLSLQYEQSLWSQREPFLSQLAIGAHFRFGSPLGREVGLRGGEADFAEYRPEY